MAVEPDVHRVVDQLTAEFHDRGRDEVERVVLESWRLFERVSIDDDARVTVAGWHARTRLCRNAS